MLFEQEADEIGHTETTEETPYPKLVTYWKDGTITVIYPPEYRSLGQDQIKALVLRYAMGSK